MRTDYTSCSGENCPVKENCRRFNGTKDSTYQSYFTEIPGKWGFRRETFDNGEIFDHREFQCELFWGRNSRFNFKSIK